jgi:hypothetical protein
MRKRMSIKLVYATLLLVTLVAVSCKKQDYITGGQKSNPVSPLTTYDYLKENAAGLFDTLITLIDAAGLKDSINQPGITFFAPTDYSIFQYLSAKTSAAQQVNPFTKYTLDSMLKYDVAKIKDSMMMYIVHTTLTYQNMTNNGAVYQTALAGDSAVISYQYTTDYNLGYSQYVTNVPQVVYFTQLWSAPSYPIVASTIPTSVGPSVLVQTSGIQTSTGMLDVLNNGHILFFYGTNL